MRYLLVVDLQKEFVKDRKGKAIYDKCLKFISNRRNEYDIVIAAVYRNDSDVNSNMGRLLNWTECKDVVPLEFIPDSSYIHTGYAIKEYPYVTSNDIIDIIGFDTDACVLAAAFDVFDLGCNMRVLTELCWSSGGRRMHDAGIAIMKRQFGKAVI